MPSPPGNPTDPELGRVLDGRFELTRFIAKGGMGKVYRATQRPLDRVVAVKLLNAFGAADEEFRKRFFLEASLCARLTHPNIVRIYDFGHDKDETYYIAMEYLEGETLTQLIRRTGPIAPRRAIHVIRQVCAALVEAHEQGMVHRDLKSSNLMLGSHALQEDFVKIVDFGIAKDLATDANVTMTGTLLGSPAYMSPEQINETEVDARSDIYSLGIILFEMLTGTLPFTHSAPVQILMGHLQKPPPALVQAYPGLKVPDRLETVVQTCLRKAREERYPSVNHLLLAIQACESELSPSHAEPGSQPPPAAEPEPPMSVQELAQFETQVYRPVANDTTDVQPPIPEDELTSTSPSDSIMDRLKEKNLRGYVGFIDFNCPFCYALHERMTSWQLVDSLEWCMVEHASHIMDGPYDLHQEQTLAREVFAVHHRAPDIQLQLPTTRCCSKVVNRLVVHVQREFSEHLSSFRGRVYRALWKQNEDISDPTVLQRLLEEEGLPTFLLELCEKDPPEIEAWQSDWENADFDCCIPVISHPASSRVLIGLATQQTLAEFLLQERSRVVDSAVCYYQQQPVILVCGWMSHLWPLLKDLRNCAEILQAPSARHAMEMLSEKAVPDLLLIEDEHLDRQELEALANLARSRSVHWALATRNPDSDIEVRALSMGAAEYLPMDGDVAVARARLGRIMRDRFSVDRLQRENQTDTLTGLTSRRHFILQMEQEWERALRSHTSLSFILMDLDCFKAFNDLHGYLAGNQVLTRIASLLRSAIERPGDLLARFGGNQFALLLPVTGDVEAQEIAKRMRLTIAQAQIEHGATLAGPTLEMSAGVSTLQARDELSIHQLYDMALENLRATRERT